MLSYRLGNEGGSFIVCVIVSIMNYISKVGSILGVCLHRGVCWCCCRGHGVTCGVYCIIACSVQSGRPSCTQIDWQHSGNLLNSMNDCYFNVKWKHGQNLLRVTTLVELFHFLLCNLKNYSYNEFKTKF